MKNLLETALEAARQAGELLREMQPRIEAREKAPADLVSDADLASQRLIRRMLSENRPEIAFQGEEEGATEGVETEAGCWVVDPLDGTTNYVHGLDNYSVSIALRQNGTAQLGVIYDPVREEMYWAVRGNGAFLNGRQLHCSDVHQLEQSLVAVSFPPRISADAPEIAPFLRILGAVQAFRRLGSAALNLAYVAAGRLDGYWATSVHAWDVAAGSLLVEEAGGRITDPQGGPFQLERPGLLAAATEPLHAELLRTVQTDR